MRWWGTGARSAERIGPIHESAASLFGKLPVAADFLRRRCAAGAGASFREWLGQAASAGDGIAVAWRTLHLAEGYPEAIVAHVEPSADATGHRRFPVAVYAAIPRDALGKDAPERFARAVPAWNTLAGTARAVRSASIAELDATLDLQTVRIDADAPNPDGPVPLRAIAAIEGRLRPGFAARMWRLRAVLNDLAARRFRGPDIPCLPLPLPPEGSTEAYGFTWLKILAALGVGGEGDAPLSVAMPPADAAAESGQAELRLLPRPPLAKDAAEWLSSSPIELRAASRISLDGFGAFESRIERMLETDAPLTRMLEVLR